jgi:hypothetical protein
MNDEGDKVIFSHVMMAMCDVYAYALFEIIRLKPTNFLTLLMIMTLILCVLVPAQSTRKRVTERKGDSGSRW